MNSAKACASNSGQFSLVDHLVKEYQDTTQIREVMMDIFMAGQNMTGTYSAL